jgi:hypothetical protein
MNSTLCFSIVRSTMKLTARAVACVAATLACCGCGSSEPPALIPDSGPASVQKPVEAAPQNSTALSSQEDLPPLADPLPPLDGGRVELAGPEGWHVPPRDPRWLAQFQLVANNPYPRILVHLPEEHEGSERVTAESAAAFAANLASQLRRELEPKGMTVPDVEPLVMGDFAGAQYTRQATIKGKDQRLDRLFLVTVQGSRRYVVELDALYGTLSQFRGHALAVVDGMKFLESEPPTSPNSQ